MKKSAIIVLVALIVFLGLAYTFMKGHNSNGEVQNGRLDGQIENVVQNSSSPIIPKAEEKQPILNGFGINIDKFDSNTKKAGDLIFDKALLFDDGRVSNDKVYIDFGHKDKYFVDSIGSIELWFHVPLNTDVIAPIAGTAEVQYLEHTKDWAVNIKPVGSNFIVSFEHVVDVPIKNGDLVTQGTLLGKAAPRTTFKNKIAMVELAVWTGGQEGIYKYCPFDFLDSTLKPTYEILLNSIAKDWESFIGKDVYDEGAWVSPGCLVDKIKEA